MTDSIKIMLVDDQRLMRDGLRTLMELVDDIEVIGEAENGAQALTLYEKLRPDVVLMDIRMPEMDGVEATRRLISNWPEARVVILTTFDDNEYVFDGLRAGAMGYLLKDVSGDELAQAVRTVSSGGALIEPSVARKVVAEFARIAPPSPSAKQHLTEALSEREVEVLDRVARGLTNKEIANQLYLAEGTVKNYVTSILGKIGARDRTQAAIRAKELGIID